MGATAALSSCGRRLALRSSSTLYISRKGQKTIAVIDLGEFLWSAKIDLPWVPSQLVRAGEQLLAVCPDASSVFPIDRSTNKPKRAFRLPVPAAWLLPSEDNQRAIAVHPESGQVVSLDLQTGAVLAKATLIGPGAYDVSGEHLGVSLPGKKSIAVLDKNTLKTVHVVPVGIPAQTLRFRKDGQTILAGGWQERQIVTVSVDEGKLLAKLQLSLTPERFCFNDDGGQMFVSGAGLDAVAIVNPYQNEVDQTILAGRTPGDMTFAPDPLGLLLVANRESGDLTIIDIQTRRVEASVHVGMQPGFVMLTPNQEFALVINKESGDLAVIRMKTVLDHKNKVKPLFTVVRVGADATSAVMMPNA